MSNNQRIFHQGIAVRRKSRPLSLMFVIALAALAWSTAQAELTWLDGPPIGPGETNHRFAQGMSPSGGVVVGGPLSAQGSAANDKAWYWTATTGVVVLGPGYAVEATDTVTLNPQVFVPGIHVLVNTPGPEMGLIYTIPTLTGLPPTTTNLSTLFPGGGTATGWVVDGRAFSNGDIVYAGTRYSTILPDGTTVRAYRQYIDANGPNQYDTISPFPGDAVTVATDMSADYNVVVGNSGNINGGVILRDGLPLLDSKPFIWSKSTGTTVFIPLSGNGNAAAVSADGSTVVGQGQVSAGTPSQAYRYRAGLVEGLGCVTFGVSAPCGPYGQGTTNSNAFDTSADGTVVVGYSLYTAPPGVFGDVFGFWWFNGVMHDLEDLLEFQGDDLQGIKITRVTAVSDDGLVVAGWGSDPSVSTNKTLSFVARLDPIALGLQGIAFDSDGDGLRDAVDSCTAVANPTQCDSDADGYGNHCDGDMNNNTATNSQDYLLFRQQIGQPSVGPTYNKADINCNGAVNAQDFVLFRELVGQPPGPSGLVP